MIQFSYINGLFSGSVTLPNPMLGYKTRINLSMDFTTLDDGHTSIYDNGAAYDRRVCDCTLVIPPADQTKLNDLLSFSARGGDLRMDLDSTGFQPFGPDKGDWGAFTVSASIRRQSGIQDEPWKYFQTDLRIVNLSSYPAYTAPAQVAEGAVTIGTVSSLRYPPPLAQAHTEYAIDTQISEGSKGYYVNRTSARDHYATDLPMVCGRGKAAALVSHITNTVRAATFSVIAPDNNYLFGNDKNGNGAYVVRLTDGTLEVCHEMPDQYSVNIPLEYISG